MVLPVSPDLVFKFPTVEDRVVATTRGYAL